MRCCICCRGEKCLNKNCRCHWYEAEVYGGKPDIFKKNNMDPEPVEKLKDPKDTA